ncbi:MAG: hypothetical protein HY268_16050 [Deltaproteobacteria bacterium]|nr:hypothetical protein [Deltaproteobacteria bacterium]
MLSSKDTASLLKTVNERYRFYAWYQDTVVEVQGHDVKWVGAASVVAGQMAAIEDIEDSKWLVEGPVVDFAKAGNKAIFDDVLPKLQSLYRSGLRGEILKGEEAKKWDEQTLHHEQFDVVDPLYRHQSTETLTYLSEVAKCQGVIGHLACYDPLKFAGDLSNPQDRYNHGMDKVVPSYESYQIEREEYDEYKRDVPVRPEHKYLGYEPGQTYVNPY